MKKIFTLLSTVIILNITASAQPVTQSQKLIGGTGDDLLFAFSNNATSDGGSIIGGSTTSSNTGTFTGLNNNGGLDGLLTKLDAGGNITLQKLYGGSGNDEIDGIRQTSDGGYIAVGDAQSSNSGTLTGITNNGGKDGWIMKLNASGTIIWQKLLGGSADDNLYSARQTADGGYIVSGSSNSSNSGTLTGLNNNGGLDAWIMKLDASGNIVWQKLLGGGSFDRFIESSPTSDGGYIAVGTATGASGTLTGLTYYGFLDGWIVKLDAAGNTVWQKLYGGGGSDDQLQSVEQTTDGGYITALASASNGGGSFGTVTGYSNYDGWVLKIDATGNIQWQKLFGGTGEDFFNVCHQTSDGGYILVGQSNSNTSYTNSLMGLTNHGGYDGWIVKLNGAGDLQWQELLGGNMDDDITTIHETSDGGYFAAGFTNSASGTGTLTGLTNNGGNDGWLVKLAPFATSKKPGSGNALQFDGSTNYVESPTENFAFGTSFSANAWIKTTDFEGDIVCNFEEASPFQGFLLGIGFGSVGNNADSRAGKLGFYVANSSVGGSYNDLTGKRVDDGKWHHVAVTYNGSNVIFYIDGKLSSTVSASNIPIGNSSNVLRIGRDNNNPGVRYLNGQIDELQLWSITLTQTQIRDWMCKKVTPSHPAYSNMVAYYKFDEGSGTTSYSVGGQLGSLINNPTWLTSGASIGDASAYNYSATPSATLAHPQGESLTATATSGSPAGIQVYRVDTVPNDTTGARGIGVNNRYFGVFVAGGTSPLYTAAYNYNGNPYVDDKASLRLYERANNADTMWVDAGAANNITSNTLTATGQHTEYILGSVFSPLPVTLFNLQAKYAAAGNVQVSWQTASEENNKGFEVYKSTDGVTFSSIGFVAGAGNSNLLLQYSFTDKAVSSGKIYYRLRQVDIDGNGKFSPIVYVIISKKHVISFSPNPVKNSITIISSDNIKEVSLVNSTGQVIKKWLNVSQNDNLDISNIPAGNYFIQFNNNGIMETQKLIKE